MLELLHRKTIIFCCLFFLSCGFVSFSLSDVTQVGFSDYNFSYNGVDSNSLTLHLQGWSETWFSFTVYNKENIPVTYTLWFVDGWYMTSDGNKACKSNNETSNFGQYISWNVSPLTLWAYSSGSRNLTAKFPNNYSWLYAGCIMYYPVIAGSWDTYVNTLPRRGWFVDAYVTPLTSDFTLIIRPTFRPSGGNNSWYSISNANFWFFVYENGAWTWRYNSAKNLSDPKININKYGTGLVSFLSPASGTLFMLAFKGSWTLSLWYTGIRNDDITQFNFYTGALADALNDEFMFRYYDWSVTGNFLKVWDVAADNSGNYDLIKDSDFTLMTDKLTLSSNISHPYWFDLDLNNVINALEQTMLLDSYNRVWFITLQNYLPTSEFLQLN